MAKRCTNHKREAATVYHVRHDQAVWEMTSFDVNVPAKIPTAEHREWIENNIDELMSAAIAAEGAQISYDDQSVETCDTSITITPADEHYG